VILDVLRGLAWLGIMEAVVATGGQAILLYRAYLWRAESLGQPLTSPERVVGDGELQNAITRLLKVLLILALGVAWLASLLRSVVPGGSTIELGPFGVAVLVVLLSLPTVALLSTVWSLLYLRRLRQSLSEQRVMCDETSYEGCPHITPERLRSIREQAQRVADALAREEGRQ
jgi:hypothetical protein